MKTKSSNNAFRTLIGAGSLLGFVGGWVILGQAPNPYAVETNVEAMVVSAPSAREVSASNAADAVSTPTAQPTVAAKTSTAQPTQAPTSGTITQIQSQSQTTTLQTTRTQTTRLRTGGS